MRSKHITLTRANKIIQLIEEGDFQTYCNYELPTRSWHQIKWAKVRCIPTSGKGTIYEISKSGRNYVITISALASPGAIATHLYSASTGDMTPSAKLRLALYLGKRARDDHDTNGCRAKRLKVLKELLGEVNE